jgi:hypothetical protein
MTDTIYQDVKPYVYMGYHPLTDKIYVGARWHNLKLNRPAEKDFGHYYFTSCNKVKPIFNEFEWEIVFEGTIDEVKELENEMIDMYLKSGILFNTHSNKNWNTTGRKDIYEKGSKTRKSNGKNNHTPESKAKISKTLTGKTSPNKGKTGLFHHTPETKAKMSEDRKGEGNNMYGVSLVKSQESREKSRQSMLGKNKGNIMPTIKCPHCNREISAGNFTRWHNDNCKLKQE